jgi:hypothetical protein
MLRQYAISAGPPCSDGYARRPRDNPAGNSAERPVHGYIRAGGRPGGPYATLYEQQVLAHGHLSARETALT